MKKKVETTFVQYVVVHVRLTLSLFFLNRIRGGRTMKEKNSNKNITLTGTTLYTRCGILQVQEVIHGAFLIRVPICINTTICA